MIVSLCMYICTHVTAAHEASLVQVPGHLFFFVINTTSLDLSKIYHAIIVTSFTSKLNHICLSNSSKCCIYIRDVVVQL